MRIFMILLATLFTFLPVSLTAAKEPTFKKIVLSDKFYAEGSHYGDFNKDGKIDIVAGPYWYAGPDFTAKHEIYPVEAFNAENYSDNFTVFGVDLNGDGWDDVFVCPHPGKQGYWFENPRGKEEHWKKHLGMAEVGNESPMWAEIIKGAGKGLIYNKNDYLGFVTYEIKNAMPDWKFHVVSTKDKRFQRYTHGIGYGDINGDGRIDLIDSEGWWEQPEEVNEKSWTFHRFKFADAGAHILVYDVNGDGLNDVVTSWHCHLYGLVWHKQVRDAEGKIGWERSEIIPIKPDLKSDALRITQMHALDAADFNGDGLLDFVTGKRFWAHGSKGDKEADAPAVLYWFELKRDGKGGATFIPHKIDNDSGVGTQVTTADLNNDKTPDIIVSNKKGTFVFLSE
ncbi:MAG: VCBS repeat-containing protein [Planctomycetaceae bacterium]|nr:VCBS repeat-containing protein [Planctomycetaceae bacterium]